RAYSRPRRRRVGRRCSPPPLAGRRVALRSGRTGSSLKRALSQPRKPTSSRGGRGVQEAMGTTTAAPVGARGGLRAGGSAVDAATAADGAIGTAAAVGRPAPPPAPAAPA